MNRLPRHSALAAFLAMTVRFELLDEQIAALRVPQGKLFFVYASFLAMTVRFLFLVQLKIQVLDEQIAASFRFGFIPRNDGSI